MGGWESAPPVAMGAGLQSWRRPQDHLSLSATTDAQGLGCLPTSGTQQEDSFYLGSLANHHIKGTKQGKKEKTPFPQH